MVGIIVCLSPKKSCSAKWRPEERLEQESQILTVGEMSCCSSWVKREMGQDVRTTVRVSRIPSAFSCTLPCSQQPASCGCHVALPPVPWPPSVAQPKALPSTDPAQATCILSPQISSGTAGCWPSSLGILFGVPDHGPGSCCCRLLCATSGCCPAPSMLLCSSFLFVTALPWQCPWRCDSRDVHSICVKWGMSRECRAAWWRYRQDTKASSSARDSSPCENKDRTCKTGSTPPKFNYKLFAGDCFDSGGWKK